MTLETFEKKCLALIEELNPDSEYLTDDEDLSAKKREVINQVMFDITRIKKLPKYVEIKVSKGKTLSFEDISGYCGYEVFQLKTVCGVKYASKADGTVLKFLEDGTAEIEVYVYPERVTEKTNAKTFEFELPAEVLEIMVYGVAADLLKSDESANFGKIYADQYETMLRRLDPRYQLYGIRYEGGVLI